MSIISLFDSLENSYGLLYPTGYIVATFLTLNEAERIASALAENQFNNIRVFNNQELVAHIAETHFRQSPIDCLRARLDNLESAAHDLLAQLSVGNHAALVLTEDNAVVQRALLILRTGHPQRMYHYENWTTTTLN